MGETRGKGEGSIYRRADGRWVGQVENGRDRNGRRQRRRVVRRTRAEVIKALARLHQESAGGIVPDNTRSLASYVAWWLENVKRGRIKDGSLRMYRSMCDRYIIPQLVHLKLGKISPGHVQQWMATIERYGLKASTVNFARKVLGNVLRHAAAHHLIPANPVSLVDGLPTGRDGKLDDTLTASDAATVLATVVGDRLEALAVLALRLGMRQGELLALRWADIDLDTAEVHVRGTLKARPYEHGCRNPQACAQRRHTKRCRPNCAGHAHLCPTRTGGGVLIDTPKTNTSERTIPLVAGTAEALRAHRSHQAAERLAAGAGWVDSGHVFTRPDGRPLTGDRVLTWWHRLCDRAGIGRRRFHATRHTCATLLLDAGVALEVVSAILGHSALATTADIYAKVTDDAKRRALRKLDNAA